MEHFEDACSRMVVSHKCGMNMFEGEETQVKTLQDKFNKLQYKLNKVNALKLQATAAAHHWPKTCLAEKAKQKTIIVDIRTRAKI